MKVIDAVKVDESEIKGKECRHISYAIDRDKKHDALFVKEYIHLKNGKIINNFKMIEDLERPFWVTKKGRRDYVTKQQWERIENCDMYTCREMDLVRRADLALGGNGYIPHRRMLFQSPYLYGCEVKPQSIVKNGYIEKYPDSISPLARVAACDTETDVLNGTEDIIIMSLSFKDRAVVAIDRNFFEGTPDTIILERLDVMLHRLLKKYIEERNLKVEFVLVDNCAEAVIEVINRAHSWEPDFIEFWNITFDIEKMITALKKNGYNPEDVFSDPRVPEKYRFFRYRRGELNKTTHDGTTSSINPEAAWHLIECPATFFMQDGMTLYYRLRLSAGRDEAGYSLNATLDRELDITKLEIDETKNLVGLAYHREMQRNYKYEYVIYCLFDSISLELLDEKTGDIAIKFPAQCRNSDYSDFRSGPKKIADNMHFHVLKEGYVFAVSDGDMRDENDKHILVSKDWICTLPSFMTNNIGIDFLEYE